MIFSGKTEDSEMGLSKSRQRKVKQQEDRSALIDITNDSPIVGLAMGSLETPSSAIAKQRSNRANNKTPGTGEALLRGQVKTLLQRVEEEAELSKLLLERRPVLDLKGFVNSPAGLLAPTPANTPQISGSAVLSPVVEEQLISQVHLTCPYKKCTYRFGNSNWVLSCYIYYIIAIEIGF